MARGISAYCMHKPQGAGWFGASLTRLALALYSCMQGCFASLALVGGTRHCFGTYFTVRYLIYVVWFPEKKLDSIFSRCNCQ